MNKYGFVYLWYDRKHKRYYLGCHWGYEDDGYVCGSTWMRNAYKRRPYDFKRRILARVDTDRSDLIDEEYRFLQMIKEEELNKRYYNKTRFRQGHCREHGTYVISELKLQERNRKISAALKGRSLSNETKEKISNNLKGRPLPYTRTLETREKIASNSKRLVAEGKVGMLGRKHSEETKRKIKESNRLRWQNPDLKEKARVARGY